MRYFLILIAVALVGACSSGVKDYSKATPLHKIETQVQVRPMWLKDTAYLPKFSYQQLKPAVQGDALYYGNIKGSVMAINANTGAALWQANIGELLSAGPGVGEGLVIMGTRKAEVIALDAKSGKQVWRSRISTEMLSQPAIVNGMVVLQVSDGSVIALNADDGQSIWTYRHEIPSLTLRGTGSPLIVDEDVIAGFSDGKLISLDLKNGELLWETTIAISRGRTDLERLVDIDGLFAVKNDVLYVSTYQGKIAAVAIKDGSILWSREFSSFTGLSLLNNHLFISDSESHVWAIDQETGETIWRQDDLADREITVPVIVDNIVVVADFDGYVHWLDAEDGHFVGRQKLQYIWYRYNMHLYDSPDHFKEHRTITTPPVVAGNKVYVRDKLGALAALQFRGKLLPEE